mgnify:CR=1 FL=1
MNEERHDDDEEEKEDHDDEEDYNDDARRLKQAANASGTGMRGNRKLRLDGKGGRLAGVNIKFQTYDARSPIARPRWA